MKNSIRLLIIVCILSLILGGCTSDTFNTLTEIQGQDTLFFKDENLQVDFIKSENPKVIYKDAYGNEMISKVGGKEVVFGEPFNDGYAGVQLKNTEGMHVIDEKGNIILEPTEKNYFYKNLGDGFFERYISFNTADGPQGLIKADGEVIYEGKNYVLFPSNEYAGFYTTDEHFYGVLDTTTFETITPEKYINITDFRYGLSVVMTEEESIYIINAKGEEITELKYETIKDYPYLPSIIARDVISITLEDKAVLINTDGEIILETQYDDLIASSEGIIICMKDNKYGYIDFLGNELLEPIYDKVTPIQNGKGYVMSGEKQYEFCVNKVTMQK